MYLFSKKQKKGLLIFSSLLLLLWCAYLFISGSDGRLIVAFLDVGQGDAIYIVSPSGKTMLIDGGPDHSILEELGKIMPFYERDIDVIMITNPDKDHIAGFIDVLKAYQVDLVLEPGTVSSSAVYRTLREMISERIRGYGMKRIVAVRGDVVDLGGGVMFHVLFPDRDVSGWSTNDGSLMGRLIYASTSIMFTGDAPQRTERYVLKNEGDLIKSDILKVGHHGSKTSTAPDFVSAVDPEFAIISAGKGNSYKHPHTEVLSTLEKAGVSTLVTAEKGTIIFTSDGKHWFDPVFVR